ncbi:MAG TPA: ABC transporter ATP-binding protein [Pantanalinema sp.]
MSDLNLTVPEGTVFGLLGPNGAGKTTTIMMLLGIIRPTAGNFSLFGRPMSDVAVRKRVGYVPEKFQLPGLLKAAEFLRFHGRMHGLGGASLEHRIVALLNEVGLGDRASSPISSLSKGMQQRLALAQALLNDPDLIILDEPTSALDPMGRMEVRTIVEGLRARGKTVLLNSHILADVEQVCDSVAILQKGKLERQGPMKVLTSQAITLHLKVGGLTAGLQDQLSKLGENFRIVSTGEVTEMELMLPSEELVPHIAEIVQAQGGRIYALSPRQESLESLFIRVVKEGRQA